MKLLLEGDTVYIFYRNPHTQNVANIQAATILPDPENNHALSIFLNECYYPITNETAMYYSEAEAEEAYDYYFGGTYE